MLQDLANWHPYAVISFAVFLLSAVVHGWLLREQFGRAYRLMSRRPAFGDDLSTFLLLRFGQLVADYGVRWWFRIGYLHEVPSPIDYALFGTLFLALPFIAWIGTYLVLRQHHAEW